MSDKKKEKPKHLGRGLASLLGPMTREDSDLTPVTITEFSGDKSMSNKDLSDVLHRINVKDIRANPYQPRTNWDEKELLELADSIKSAGLIQPLVVRQSRQGYEIITGERRFRAACMAGLTEIPAIVREANDEQMLELALIENIHRSDLNPIERATAYKNYIDKFSLTQAQAAQRLGEDRSVVANYIRLLDLPQEIIEMLIDTTLSMGHARAILALPNDDLRRKLANRALAGRLSVREVERLVRHHLDSKTEGEKPKPPKAPHIEDLEKKLTSQLGTRVNINTRKNGYRGKIVIEFYSLNDFDRITELLGITDEY